MSLGGDNAVSRTMISMGSHSNGRGQVRRMPVLDHALRLVGIVAWRYRPFRRYDTAIDALWIFPRQAASIVRPWTRAMCGNLDRFLRALSFFFFYLIRLPGLSAAVGRASLRARPGRRREIGRRRPRSKGPGRIS